MQNFTITYAVLLVIIAGIIGVGTLAFGGKAKASTRKMIGWLTVAILVVGFVGLIPGVSDAVPWFGQTALGKTSTYGNYSLTYSLAGNQGTQGNGNAPINIVTTNPTPSVAGQDSQNLGTTVTNTLLVSVNKGAFAAATATAPGANVINTSVYHTAVVQNQPNLVDAYPVKVLMNKNATVTETVYYKNTALTNNGGANNITDLGNGISYALSDEMQANALTSTQEMLCVVELSAGVNASTDVPAVTLTGRTAESKDISAWYTVAGTNSKTYVFTVPAISTTATAKNDLLVTAKSTGRFSPLSTIKKTCYTKEWFVDPKTNALTFDVADSQGTIKSMARYTATVAFQ